MLNIFLHPDFHGTIYFASLTVFFARFNVACLCVCYAGDGRPNVQCHAGPSRRGDGYLHAARQENEKGRVGEQKRKKKQRKKKRCPAGSLGRAVAPFGRRVRKEMGYMDIRGGGQLLMSCGQAKGLSGD